MILCRCPSWAPPTAGTASATASAAATTHFFCISSPLVLVQRPTRLGRIGAALQEFLLFQLLSNFIGRPRVHCFHLLDPFRRELWQFADEVHEFPALNSAVLCARGPRRHPRQPHAVLDDEKQLAVGKCLCGGKPHIRWLWVQPTTDVRVAAAVVRVAGRAMVSVMRHRLRHDILIFYYR